MNGKTGKVELIYEKLAPGEVFIISKVGGCIITYAANEQKLSSRKHATPENNSLMASRYIFDAGFLTVSARYVFSS